MCLLLSIFTLYTTIFFETFAFVEVYCFSRFMCSFRNSENIEQSIQEKKQHLPDLPECLRMLGTC